MAKKRFVLKMLVLFIFVLVCPLGAEGLPPIEIHFVDVGQGDAILIKVPNGENILIDTGNLSAGYKLEKYLKDHGVFTLSALIITHMHPDHVGGVFGILPDIGAEKMYDNGAKSPNNEFWHEYINFIGDLRLDRGILKSGSTLSFGALKLLVLSPSKPLSGNLNADSIVIRISYGDVKILLMADANMKVEEKLIKEGNVNLASQVLKVGHHGATDATSEAFLGQVDPEIAVISVGRSNRYGYPSGEIIKRIQDRGIRLFRTDVRSSIVISSDGENIGVRCVKE